MNLIHVDDAADVVTLVDEVETISRLLNVSDGHPVARREFYRQLARLIGACEPRFAENLPQNHDRNARTDDKRISNRRLVNELSITLQFPTYREGLATIVGVAT